MTIEDKIYSESLKLSEAYFPYYIKKYPRNKYQVYNTYKKFFLKAARMFCIRDNYDAKKLIQAFMADGFKFPQQLCNETVWKTYISYLPGLQNEKSEDKILIEDIIGAVIETNKYGGVKEWLAKVINQRMLLEDKLKFNPTYLAFSESFINFYNSNYDNFKTKLNLESLRNRVTKSPYSKTIMHKIKANLKDDYYLRLADIGKELAALGIVF